MRAVNQSIMKTFLAFAILFAAPSAFAACSWLVLPAPIAFGTYSVFGGASNTTTTSGTVRCVGNFDFTVSSSTGAGGSYNPRVMGGAQYNVYMDPARTFIWGNGTAGTNVYAANADGTPATQDFSGSAYGTVFGGQDLAPGAYNDNLTVILAYRPGGGGPWTNLPGVSIPITMTVTAECRVNTFNLPFGNYSPLAVAALPGSSTVNVYCTRTTPATFALNNGANPLGVQKRMVSGVNFLNYTATLGSASGTSTSTLVPIGNGIPLNASIPASQDVPIGSYIDTLQVVVNY